MRAEVIAEFMALGCSASNQPHHASQLLSRTQKLKENCTSSEGAKLFFFLTAEATSTGDNIKNFFVSSQKCMGDRQRARESEGVKAGKWCGRAGVPCYTCREVAELHAAATRQMDAQQLCAI